MKLISSAILALAAVNKAQQGNEVDGKKLQQTNLMLAHILPGAKQDAKDIVFRHGCYCFSRPGGLVGPRNGYHGAPLDELDALCRDLYRSQKCLPADIAGCHADQAYPFTKHAGGSVSCGPDPITSPKWASRPNNACKLQTCELELEFANAVNALVDSGYVADPAVSYIKDADYDAACPAIATGIPPPALECCGNGIGRKPFNGVTNQCCNDLIVTPGSC